MYKLIFRIFILVCFSITSLSCSTTTTASTGTWLNHDRRTSGTIVDDQAITIKTNLAITRNKELWSKSHISTLSFNNSVLLTGQTPTVEMKQEVESLLRPIPEISNIYNQITIEKPISFGVRAQDTWLTTQVKSKIITNRDIGPNRVKVITENSVVYLMGMLSKDEERIVVDITRRVSGVKHVVKVFERLEKHS